jgi:hypothetical protein
MRSWRQIGSSALSLDADVDGDTLDLGEGEAHYAGELFEVLSTDLGH